MSIKTKAIVNKDIEDNKHPLDHVSGHEGEVNGWGVDSTGAAKCVSYKMVMAALAEKNNAQGKGPSISTHGSEGTTAGRQQASKSNSHQTVRCRHPGCKHIMVAKAEFVHVGKDSANAICGHQWTVTRYVKHNCTQPATKSRGRSNCAFDAKQMAYAIQNERSILEQKTTSTIRAAMENYTDVEVSPSYIANVKSELIKHHEGTLSENLKKIRALEQRIRDRGHHIKLCVVEAEEMREIAIRNAKVAWVREQRKKCSDDKVEFDKKQVDVSAIISGRTYIVGFSFAHQGFIHMRKNGCSRVSSTDASHMKSNLKGTAFGTVTQNANGMMVPSGVSYHLEAEGFNPWDKHCKNIAEFDPSYEERPSGGLSWMPNGSPTTAEAVSLDDPKRYLVDDDEDLHGLQPHEWVNKGDGDKGMYKAYITWCWFHDSRHFNKRFDKCTAADKKLYYTGLHATSQAAVEAAVLQMSPKAKKIVEKYDKAEIFPAFSPFFVRGNHTSNISESFMYRLDRSNPNYVHAVRQSKDLFNAIVSTVRMCEAMFEIRVQEYWTQSQREPPDLLTKFARDKIKKSLDEANKWPSTIMSNTRRKNGRHQVVMHTYGSGKTVTVVLDPLGMTGATPNETLVPYCHSNVYFNATCSRCHPSLSTFPALDPCAHMVQAMVYLGLDAVHYSAYTRSMLNFEREVKPIPAFEPVDVEDLEVDDDCNLHQSPFDLRGKGAPKKNKRTLSWQDIAKPRLAHGSQTQKNRAKARNQKRERPKESDVSSSDSDDDRDDDRDDDSDVGPIVFTNSIVEQGLIVDIELYLQSAGIAVYYKVLKKRLKKCRQYKQLSKDVFTPLIFRCAKYMIHQKKLILKNMKDGTLLSLPEKKKKKKKKKKNKRKKKHKKNNEVE